MFSFSVGVLLVQRGFKAKLSTMILIGIGRKIGRLVGPKFIDQACPRREKNERGAQSRAGMLNRMNMICRNCSVNIN